ncbi:hypothetical protein C1645_812242 [Glomus cerebriforme]|uniref:Uncharacterized protein n=1 Tax=Glomus cerebriforme TaxID=658196 RepID=A0A397TLF5_9GLOM|nr:hypothetical protein C1645_812242 [Glomus cerebriforme]
MNNNNLLQNNLSDESNITDIEEFYDYHNTIQSQPTNITNIQLQTPPQTPLNINHDNDLNPNYDYTNEFYAMDNTEYLPFDCNIPTSDQNFQQSMTPNEYFTSTSNYYPQCIPLPVPLQQPISSGNFSYIINVTSINSPQTNICEVFKFEYNVTIAPVSPLIFPIINNLNILDIQEQSNYFSSIDNSQFQFQQ